ncbi:MAG: agarase [Planctomycetota bacterium]|jgi:hypothetical protein
METRCGILAAMLLPLLLGGGAVNGAGEEPPPERPLIVEARIKDGPARRFETRILSHLSGFDPSIPVETDKYGGWKGKRYSATGFFYPKKIDGRWWLIDPEGYRFLHVAVNSVRPGDSPQNRRTFPAEFGTREKWRDATVALLRNHGFNGTGCWSDDRSLAGGPDRLVYTPTLRLMSGYGRQRGRTYQEPGHTGYPNKCILVFDPEFEAYADEAAKPLARLKDDPYLLGYFSDNEMPFPQDSLDRYLQLDSQDPGYRAARAWLARRKGDGADASTITSRDRDAWRGYVARRYLSMVARAIKRHDPNHLYLGSRFYSSEKRCKEVFQAAGEFVDVISVNVYGVWTPSSEMLQRWAQWSGRPLVVTEWYAKGNDSGLANLTGAGWTVATQQQRGWFYQNFVLALVESRAVYRPLLDSMQSLNSAVYRLAEHFDR